jgi:hypothetical protein
VFCDRTSPAHRRLLRSTGIGVNGESRWLRAGAALLGVMSVLLTSGCAISTVRAPSWSASPPNGFRFEYVTGTGVGGDAALARRAALEDAYQVLRASGPRAYQTAAFRQEFETVTQQSLGASGAGALTGSQQLRTTGRMDGTIGGTDIPRLEIVHVETARCLRCTEYTVFVLFRYPKPHAQQRTPPSTASLFARNLVLPGWGQMVKGQRKKGWTLLTLALAGGGVALVAHQQRQDAFARAGAATSQAARDIHLGEAAGRKPMLLGGLGVGATVYGVALIDVVAAPPSYYASAVPVRRPLSGVGVEVPLLWGRWPGDRRP